MKKIPHLLARAYSPILIAMQMFILAQTTKAQDFSSDSKVSEYEVTAKKLDESRNNLSVKTGGSSFVFNQNDIDNLPQGQATSLSQVLSRAPSVVQNSQNQLHVRGDHANLQYRINGVMLPDGVNGFAQKLDTHFVDSIDFLTGAMPAQYGIRTAGVVDIKTKSGSALKGARSEFMFGGNDLFQANQQVGGNKSGIDYYLNATYLQNSRGIEATTAARNSNHNDTSQDNIFGYFSKLLDLSKRVSVIVSNSTNRYQIPNNPNQAAEFDLSGATADSNYLNEKQVEQNRFAIASLDGINNEGVSYQWSLFSSQSNMQFKPDYNGDLIFNGIASSLNRNSVTNGLQGDFSYQINDKNTLRSGIYATTNRVESQSSNWVFEGSGHGHSFVQTSTIPFKIDDNGNKTSNLYSGYLQNEWKTTDKLTLNYGARFDISQAYVRESQLSPRFGGVYNLSEKTKVNFGYARYFTPAPTSQISQNTIDKFEGTSNEAEVGLNGKVKAERSNYFDLGVTHKATKNLTLALDSYYRQVKNMQDEHQFGNSLLYSPFNYEKGKAYGVEFKADYKKDNFASYLNFAAQRAYAKNIVSAQYIVHEEEYDYIKNNYVRLDHAQNYTAAIGASYIFLKTKFAADAIFGSGLSTGENNKNTMPSYWQFNGSVSRDLEIPLIGKINSRISAINLLDEVYQYSDGSGIGVSASQYAPRRTFYLTFSKKF